jgi:hypothetical protein
MRVIYICTFAVGVLAGSSALAEEDIEYDRFSTVSEQNLMLTGEIQTNFGKSLPGFLSDLGFDRFDQSLGQTAPDAPEAFAWCEKAVKDQQVRRDDTDAETGEAVDTVKSLQEACNRVFKYDLSASVSCKTKTDKKTKKRTVKCNSTGQITFSRYKLAGSNDGLTADSGWQKQGTLQIKSTGSGSSTIAKPTKRNPNPAQKAKKSARSSAISGLASGLSRAMKEVDVFQIQAPIIGRKGSMALNCLGKNLAPLDFPMEVVFKSPKGKKVIGFAKIRKAFNGCTETPSIAERKAAGEKIVLKPAEAQVILGGSRAKAGFTLWELPTSGVDIIVGGDLRAMYEGGSAPALILGAEYNLAKFTGVSELFASVELFVSADGGAVRDAVAATDPFNVTGDSITIGGADLLAIKRIYMGPLYIQVGAGLTAARYQILDDDEWSYGITSYGGAGQGGIGMQLSSRLMVDGVVGYRYLLPTVSFTDKSDNSSVAIPGAESKTDGGLNMGLRVRYTY